MCDANESADINADNNNNVISLERINKGTNDDERENNERSIRAGRFLRLNFVLLLLLLLHCILFTFLVFSPNMTIANKTTTIIIIIMEMRVYVRREISVVFDVTVWQYCEK